MYQLVNKTYIDMTILPISVAILILTVGHIFTNMPILPILVNIKKLLISKRRIGILKKLPKQGEDSESL